MQSFISKEKTVRYLLYILKEISLMSEFPWQDYRFSFSPAVKWVQHGIRLTNEIKRTSEFIQIHTTQSSLCAATQLS